MTKKITLILGMSLLFSLMFSPEISFAASSNGKSDAGISFYKKSELPNTDDSENTDPINKGTTGNKTDTGTGTNGAQTNTPKDLTYPKTGEQLMKGSFTLVGIILLLITLFLFISKKRGEEDRG